jgi:hypothetical protein
MHPGPAANAVDGPLLLADISGYTSFLRAVQQAHQADAFADGKIPDAYALMSALLDGIITKLVPPFTLSKLEGDAVFAFAEDGAAVPQADALLACFAACYADFRERLAAAMEVQTCSCGACSRSIGLDLKFVLHAGPFVIQSMGGGRELIGPEVVMAHRLLKTGAADAVGNGAYALVSAAAATRFDVPTKGSHLLIEQIEHYPPIELFVFPLRP